MACLISTFQNVQSMHQIHHKAGAVLIICSFYLQGSGEIISPKTQEEQLKQIYKRNKVKQWIFILLISSAYVRLWVGWGSAIGSAWIFSLNCNGGGEGTWGIRGIQGGARIGGTTGIRVGVGIWRGWRRIGGLILWTVGNTGGMIFESPSPWLIVNFAMATSPSALLLLIFLQF